MVRSSPVSQFLSVTTRNNVIAIRRDNPMLGVCLMRSTRYSEMWQINQVTEHGVALNPLLSGGGAATSRESALRYPR